ncbi:unnamed protein product, partial [Prorocentrum cordatum]
AQKWLRKAIEKKPGDDGYFDAFALQETHLGHDEVELHEQTLHNMGLKAVASFTLIIISNYIDGNCAILNGTNGRKIATLTSSLLSISQPWVIVGDWNHTPKQAWDTGWPKQIGNKVMALPSDSCICFKRGSEQSLIDFALVSSQAERHISHVTEIRDVLWRQRDITKCSMRQAIHHRSQHNNSKSNDDKYSNGLRQRDGKHSRHVDGIQIGGQEEDIDPFDELGRHLDIEESERMQQDSSGGQEDPKQAQRVAVALLVQLGGDTDQEDETEHSPPQVQYKAEQDIPTTCMDDLWHCMTPIPTHATTASTTPPTRITESAAYKATESETVVLGAQRARPMQDMENLYCAVYHIPIKERKLPKGRGLPNELKCKEQKEREPRHARYTGHNADGWHRTANTLNIIEQLKKRNRGKEMQDRAATTCRLLAVEGLPPLGHQASATARLHRKIWKTRLLNIDKQDIDILEGMRMQAEQQAHTAPKEDIAKGRKAYIKWITTAAKEPPGKMHTITTDGKRCEQELLHKLDKKHSPMGKMGTKLAIFESIWHKGHTT